MGLIAKAATNRTMQPRAMPLGTWFASEADPGLDAFDRLALAEITALLGTDTDRSRDRRGRVLRYERLLPGRSRFVLGVPCPHEIVRSEWQVLCEYDGTAVQVSIPECVTVNDEIASKSIVDELRDGLAHAYASGPRTSHSTRAVDLSSLVSVTSARPKSFGEVGSGPLERDHLPTVTSGFADGTRIVLPAGGASEVQRALAAGGVLPTSDDGSVLLDCGRDAGDRLDVRVGPEGEAIVLVLPGASSSSVGALRTVIAALRARDELARALGNGSPTGQVLRDWVESPMMGTDPRDWLRREWVTGAATESVPVPTGGAFPVVLAVPAGMGGGRQLVAASLGSVPRVRSHTPGLSEELAEKRARKGKHVDRAFTLRDPATVGYGDPQVARLRYSERASLSLSNIGPVPASDPWFWELTAHEGSGGAASRKASFAISGLSVVDGAVTYGTELLSTMRGVVGASLLDGGEEAVVTTWLHL